MDMKKGNLVEKGRRNSFSMVSRKPRYLVFWMGERGGYKHVEVAEIRRKGIV